MERALSVLLLVVFASCTVLQMSLVDLVAEAASARLEYPSRSLGHSSSSSRKNGRSLGGGMSDNHYCQGEYAPNKQNCAKFQFGNDPTPCVETTNCTTFFDIESFPDQSIDEHTTNMVQLITNVFEVGDTVMGFGDVEKENDGRGYTSGYVGFTTGTNDAYAVVKEYTKRKPNNILAKYLPELERLSSLKFCDPGRNDVSKLKQYFFDWTTAACSDPLFVQTQFDVGHAQALKPSLKFAAAYGVHSNLGKSIFYDTIIMHGWQYVEPLINIYRILALNGYRGSGESEQAFLNRFLKTRRQLMCCVPGATDIWAGAADRVSDLQNLLNNWDQNKDLQNPVHLEAYGETVHGNEQLVFDTHHCPTQKHPTQRVVPNGWTLPGPEELPIPDKC